MAVAISTRAIDNSKASEYEVNVGQYGEGMYCINCPSTLSDEVQHTINSMLLNNQGVGIIGGYLDDKLTICMISGLAVRTFGYDSIEEFLNETQSSLLNMSVSDEERMLLKNRLSSTESEIFSYYLKGKNGKSISFRMGNVLLNMKNGRTMWYISVRRLGELHHDSLTGAYNRQGFIQYINGLKNSGVDLTDYAIIAVNIKGFKAINDLYGADIGDNLLIDSYAHFNACRIKPVACARKSSDRFLLLVKKELLDLDILPEELKIPYRYGDKSYYANCVCRIYYIDDAEININSMIDYAKIARINVVDEFVKPYTVFVPTMKADYINRTSVLSMFDDALQKNEFKVYYQPVINCKTGQIVSAEALIRWETNGDVLSPAKFIPAFEENGCIVKLDEYVLTKVVKQLRYKAENDLPIVPISVNLSRMDFFDDERINRLCEVFRQNPIVRRFVRFEITETSHLSVKEKQEDFIKKIRSLDGMVYIDDFGVANSSLDMLSQYDFEIMKLDMQFIRAMEKNDKVRTLVDTTINTAHRLNMKVVAEGVETKEQFDILHSFDCDYIQGYYFSKPLPQEEFEKYLAEHL